MGKIKALLRSVFRYRLISAFFIISQLVMFYAVFGVLSIYNRHMQRKRTGCSPCIRTEYS